VIGGDGTVIDLVVRGVRLRGEPDGALSDLLVDRGRFAEIRPGRAPDPAAAPLSAHAGREGAGELPPARTVIDARGAFASPPYVEPHVHLDATLTAGEPRWNASGTLWEGIACWSERKAMLSRADVIDRATEVLRWQAANGVLHVRSHVDVTDPRLVALDALAEVADRVRDIISLQLVAFPQEGICSFPDGERLIEEAVARGAGVIGAIPHFEDTREDGVRSLEIAAGVAVRHGLMLDAHCDETDDEQSRFAEVLATLAARGGLRERATASHTTAMGSYNAAYALKLERILARSGINLVSNPLVNLHLQGRLDDYPKRRGLTRVKEMLAAGINVAFGHDDIMDPWYPLGTGNPVQVAFVGAHATQLTSPAEIAECFRMVTDRAAAVLGLGEAYGIAPGRPASFILLPASGPFDVVRRQVRPSHVVAHGQVVATTPASVTTLRWPGSPAQVVDFVRRRDAAGAAWRDSHTTV
jgi:cytosine deaminase